MSSLKIYGLVMMETGDDVSCCTHTDKYELSEEQGGRIYNERRLAHTGSLSHPGRYCARFNETDLVRCYYLFGETLLVTKHYYGHCPWKLFLVKD